MSSELEQHDIEAHGNPDPPICNCDGWWHVSVGGRTHYIDVFEAERAAQVREIEAYRGIMRVTIGNNEPTESERTILEYTDRRLTGLQEETTP